MNTASVTHWSTLEYEPGEQFVAWDSALNDNYGSWISDHARPKTFNAQVERIEKGSMRVIKCRCEPCKGTRPARLAKAERDHFAVVQLVKSGKEVMVIDEAEHLLEAGDLIVWDSTRPMMFDVRSELDKVSLLMPLDTLRRWLPNDWRGVAGKLPRRSASHILLRPYIEALSTREFAKSQFCDASVLDAGLALLSGGPDANDKREQSRRKEQLRGVKAFILENLANPELAPAEVANSLSMSTRYLHWLFSGSGSTLAAYIQEQRLQRCRQDLINPRMASRTIAEIAFGWGFNNAAHFSRIYKTHHSETPSDTRKRIGVS